MFRLIIGCYLTPLWASPSNTIYDEMLRAGGWRGQRRSISLVPAYSIYGRIDELLPPAKPIPTDVPFREPRDELPPETRPTR